MEKRAGFARRLFLIVGLFAAMIAAPIGASARGHSARSSRSSSHSKKSTESHPERTQKVRGYTKKNGTHVAPYKRAPRGQGKSKKKKL